MISIPCCDFHVFRFRLFADLGPSNDEINASSCDRGSTTITSSVYPFMQSAMIDAKKKYRWLDSRMHSNVMEDSISIIMTETNSRSPDRDLEPHVIHYVSPSVVRDALKACGVLCHGLEKNEKELARQKVGCGALLIVASK